MTRVFIDIETLPDMDFDKSTIEVSAPAQYKKPESIAKWITDNGDRVREEEWRKQALSADRGGQILSISCALDDDREPECFYLNSRGDSLILAEFYRWLECSCKSHPYFIGHNVPFDLEFIWKRSVIAGMKPHVKMKWSGRHGSDYFDTMQEWAGFRGRISQDRLASLLGIEQKPGDINGSNVLDHYQAGSHEKIQQYNKYDVETVRRIFHRIS